MNQRTVFILKLLGPTETPFVLLRKIQGKLPMLAAFAELVHLVFDDLEEHFRPAIQEMPTWGRPITTHQPATEEKQ